MRFLLLFLITGLAAAATPLLQDDFADPKLPSRRALRGEWQFAENTATCTQDDELYRKNKDHGPILFYDLAYTDASVGFAFKPEASTKTVVFTANGEDGHIFRIVFGQTGTSIRAFPPNEPNHKSIALATEKDLRLRPGEWTSVKLELRGAQALVTSGAFKKTYEHSSLARPKSNLSIGFSFGTVSVKDFVVEN